MILIIYQNEVMREVLLPNINNSDYKVYIDKDLYLLNKSLYLNFESVNQEWYICDGRNYAITYNHEQQNKILLNNTEMFNIRTFVALFYFEIRSVWLVCIENAILINRLVFIIYIV